MNKTIKTASAALYISAALFLLGLVGCADPAAPSIPPTQTAKPTAVPTASITNLTNNLVTGVTLQPLPMARTSKPQVSVTQFVSSDAGGKLEGSFWYVSKLGASVTVKASLTIPPGALPQSKQITMTFDTTYCAVRFKPEGLVFNTPASLEYAASNVALIGINLGFWYDDESGNFTLLPSNISLYLFGFEAKNCQVPHFSRYAFGR
jgi:hypothetical protein